MPNLQEAAPQARFVWSFDWSDVPKADRYQFAITNRLNSRHSRMDGIVETSQFDYVQRRPVRTHESDEWNYVVRARVDGAWTVWSEPRRFEVATTSIESEDLVQLINFREADEPTPVEMPRQVESLSRLELTPPKNYAGFTAFAFSPDGQRVAGGIGTFAGGGNLLLWDANTGELLHNLPTFDKPQPAEQPADEDAQDRRRAQIQWLKFSQDGTRLAVVSNDYGLVKIWNVSEQKVVQSIELGGGLHSHNGLFPRVDFSADGKTLAALIQDVIPIGSGEVKRGGRLVIYDVETGEERWSEENSGLDCLAILSDDTSLVCVSKEISNVRLTKEDRPSWNWINPLLTIRDLGDGTIKNQIDRVRVVPTSLWAIPGRSAVAAFKNDGMAIIEIPSGEESSVLKWNKDLWANNNVRFSQDGKRMARSWNDYVEILNLETGEVEKTVLAEFPHGIFNAGFSAKLDRIVCSSSGPVILSLSDR